MKKLFLFFSITLTGLNLLAQRNKMTINALPDPWERSNDIVREIRKRGVDTVIVFNRFIFHNDEGYIYYIWKQEGNYNFRKINVHDTSILSSITKVSKTKSDIFNHLNSFQKFKDIEIQTIRFVDHNGDTISNFSPHDDISQLYVYIGTDTNGCVIRDRDITPIEYYTNNENISYKTNIKNPYFQLFHLIVCSLRSIQLLNRIESEYYEMMKLDTNCE